MSNTSLPLSKAALNKLFEEAFAEAKRRARKDENRYRYFRRQYRNDPVAFVHDCFRWDKVKSSSGPTDYQIEILAAIPKDRRVSVRGPHGLGKTAMSSWVIHWFALTRDIDEDWKIPTTASVWRQLTKYLWPEIHKWGRVIDWKKVGREPYIRNKELMTLSLRLNTGEAFALATEDETAIEGAHADHLLYVFDESKAIKPAIFDAAEGAFSGGGVEDGIEAYALAISTPGDPEGRFYEIHARKPGLEDWNAIHVTLDMAIKAGRISREWAEQRRRQWGENSQLYINRVLGDFAESQADRTIPLSWVEEAVERWYTARESGIYRTMTMTSLGIDVGRGNDKTILAPILEGWFVEEMIEHGEISTTSITRRTQLLLRRRNPRAIVVVDVIGVGAGVVDQLRDLKLRVIPFNAKSKAVDQRGKRPIRDRSGELEFTNLRAAAWWMMRELLDPMNDPRIAIPDDDELISELTAPGYKTVQGGKIAIESKDDIKKRLGRSTDKADALIMGLVGPKVRLVSRPGSLLQGKVKGWQPTQRSTGRR